MTKAEMIMQKHAGVMKETANFLSAFGKHVNTIPVGTDVVNSMRNSAAKQLSSDIMRHVKNIGKSNPKEAKSLMTHATNFINRMSKHV